LFSTILRPDIQKFIHDSTDVPVAQLALKKNPFPDVDWTAILNQVAARQKAKEKLPTWFKHEDIIYPQKVSVEQTSSETAAHYKATLVSGDSLIDLTGGFGVDDFYFSKSINSVTHCELNPELSAIAVHNFKVLGGDNIDCVPGDSLDTLKKLDKQWDWIYIDPSRRNDAKGKVFLLEDCLPNVPQLLSTYLSYTNNIVIKTAPILDITAGLSELHSVKAVHIIAINNEVKELLWVIEKGFKGNPMLHAVSISREGTQTVTAPHNNDAEPFYALLGKYLYEPNSAIMKSGAFNAVATQYNLNKLHANTQLYTSDALIDFPGRRFTINAILPYQKAAMKKFIEGKKMNVTARNFPLTVDETKKKWKISDGGDVYCFFTTNMNNEKIVLLCGKI
jgi:hypothetical protein